MKGFSSRITERSGTPYKAFNSLENTEKQEITYSEFHLISGAHTQWHIAPLVGSVGGVGEYPSLHLNLYIQCTVFVCAVWTRPKQGVDIY